MTNPASGKIWIQEKKPIRENIKLNGSLRMDYVGLIHFSM